MTIGEAKKILKSVNSNIEYTDEEIAIILVWMEERAKEEYHHRKLKEDDPSPKP